MSVSFRQSRIRLFGTDTQLHVLAFIILSCVLGASYLSLSRGLPGPFLIDDIIRIKTQDIHTFSPAGLARSVESTDVGLFGRPLSLTSLFLTKYLHGNSPGPYKHENILFHLVTGLLLMWLIYRLLAAPSLANWVPSEAHRTAYATFAATLWLLHPLHVSTVLYAVQRMTILSTLFTTLALLAYVASRQVGVHHIRGLVLLFLLLPLFGILAVFSKENAVLIPVYILAIELIAFRFYWNSRGEQRALWAGLAIVVAMPLLAGSAYLATHLDSLLYDYAVRDFTLAERLATQAVVVWHYVLMLLIPALSGMSLYHDAVTIQTLSSPAFVPAVLGWIAVVGLAVYLHSRLPVTSLGLVLYVCSQLLESTFLPLELVFEHRNYFGSIGLFLVITDLLGQLWARFRSGRKIVVPTVIVLVSLLAFQTATRAFVWQDEERLLMVTVSDHPTSDRAASALANLRLRQGDLVQARDTLEQAIARPPHRGRAGLRVHLLATYCSADQEPPQALYRDVLADLAHEPLQAYVLSGINVIAESYRNDNCPGLAETDIASLFRVAGNNPFGRRTNKFYVNFLAARFFTSAGDFVEAESAYQRALGYRHNVPTSVAIRALIDLADVQIHLQQLDQAEDTVAAAQQLVASSFLDHPAARQALQNQREALEQMSVSVR